MGHAFGAYPYGLRAYGAYPYAYGGYYGHYAPLVAGASSHQHVSTPAATYGISQIHKRSADAEPEAEADAEAAAAYYGGYYGRGYGYGYGYGLGHRGYYGGYYGHPYGYRAYGYGHYLGKRSADAEPEADAEAGVALYGHAFGYPYGLRAYGAYPYAYGGYYGHYAPLVAGASSHQHVSTPAATYGISQIHKRSADAEPEAEADAEAA